jgi:DNA-binding beta-propeller fold protein YncE
MTITDKPIVSALGVYNSRLYVASETGNTIYRFNQDKRSFSFSNRQEWLKEPLNLKNISSLSINGKIFMIADNQLQRFNAGKKDSLTLEEASPALEAPTELVTSIDQSLIFMMEPKNKRIVIYRSDGKYKSQYTSGTFTDLHGVAISEDNKKMFVLNDKTIYEIDLK